MQFKKRTLLELADMICGNVGGQNGFFVYRTSSFLTQFFEDCGTEYRHDGSTRNQWASSILEQILTEPHSSPYIPPDTFSKLIRLLMDPADATNECSKRKEALTILNNTLSREGFEAFYAPNKQCYIRHIDTNTEALMSPNPHRPFSQSELKKREELVKYLDQASEDQLIEEVLLPLFRQIGYHRITATGHKDKALEYGKDIWMRFSLPTQHVIYFGIQVKKGKIDSSGVSKANVAEIHNQAMMMLGHEIFDPEIGKQVLVDHAFIISGGDITKAAKNWLGNKLDVSKRSQIMFMDREDIINLYAITNLPVPIINEAKSNNVLPF